jgi:hypothetical protein
MEPKRKNYTVQLEPEFVDKLDKLAGQLDLSRGQLMRNCMMSGFDDAVMLKKLGILQTVNYIQKLRELKKLAIKEKMDQKRKDK